MLDRQECCKLGNLIVVVSRGKAYLYRSEGPRKQRNHAYIGRLNDIESISQKLSITKEEAINRILELAKKRLEKTKKAPTRELMELILFDPACYFE